MTHIDSEGDVGETSPTEHDDTDEDLTTRVDELETKVEEQQSVIRSQRERLDQLGHKNPLITRRGALAAGGILGLVGMGAGTGTADPQGQAGENEHVGLSVVLSPRQPVPTQHKEETVVFDQVRRDDFDGYDSQTGVYTVQESGDYHVDFMLSWEYIVNENERIHQRLKVNGSTNRGIRWSQTIGAADTPDRNLSKTIFGLSPGDTLEVAVQHSVNEGNSIRRGFWTIHKVGGVGRGSGRR